MREMLRLSESSFKTPSKPKPTNESKPKEEPKPTISSKNAEILMREGLLTPIVKNKRKISSLLLSASRATISTLTTRKKMAPRRDWIKIPAFVESAATFNFIGYSGSMAPKLWSRYVRHCRDEVAVDRVGNVFSDFVQWHIEDSEVLDVSHSGDSWVGCLKKLGVNERLAKAILHPQYEDVRFTATCKFWVIESMQTDYKALQDLDKKLTTSVSLIQQWRELEYSSFPGPVVEAPRSMEGHAMFWRADSRSRINDFYIGKEVNLAALGSRGDFNCKESLTYWTRKRTAERYAGWARQRAQIADIDIVQVAVPFDVIGLLRGTILEDQGQITDEWRKLILSTWKKQEVPRELEYIKEGYFIAGHISSGKRVRYELITDYTKISQSDVLHDANWHLGVTGQFAFPFAYQCAFNTHQAQERFEKQCMGKIWSHSLKHDE